MILLLGGTTESLEVADLFNQMNLDFTVSVISDYGAELAHHHAKQVKEITFDEESFERFCLDEDVDLVVDATHPFARVISQLAIQQTTRLQIPYLRFERQSLDEQSTTLIPVDSFDQACDYFEKIAGTIYLSTGSKTAPDYADRLGVERLHVRVLPTTKVLENLTSAGFVASQIDGIQGPFTKDLNVGLFEKAHAAAVVTKESGRQGGIQEKIAACQELGIPCVIIRRPRVDYPAAVASLAELQSELEGNYGR